jgi:hypothetical protein
MPVEEIAGSLLGGIARFLAWMFVDLLFHTIILGTGYMVMSVLAPKKEPSETACAIAGLIAWILIALTVFGLYRATLA